ncbi:MAG: type II toxin-antitoxin system HigB family toxin [Methylobacteriaceae bacterium]|nr:type II toxin-antitoxin system HigB family toxin [Methylobacteriaceae bacterium]MCO5087995.1 type II toxin-antitoxin system HigB family toxin [Methylobacteriaceae bacterium]
MRIIKRSTLVAFWIVHPETRSSLEYWLRVTSAAHWKTSAEVRSSFPKASVLNAECVRFDVAGGNYRLIVAFRFDLQIAWVKFIGTHAEYDAVDALTVSRY